MDEQGLLNCQDRSAEFIEMQIKNLNLNSL
jgi:hypothetical protein